MAGSRVYLTVPMVNWRVGKFSTYLLQAKETFPAVTEDFRAATTLAFFQKLSGACNPWMVVSNTAVWAVMMLVSLSATIVETSVTLTLHYPSVPSTSFWETSPVIKYCSKFPRVQKLWVSLK